MLFSNLRVILSSDLIFQLGPTAFVGSKGIAQPPHQYYRSQALEEGVRDCMLVGGGALRLRVLLSLYWVKLFTFSPRCL